MKRKELKIEEICCGMPHVKKYLKVLDNQIKRFDMVGVTNPEVEKLKEKEKMYLSTIANMTSDDIRALHYIQNIKRFQPYRVLEVLRSLNEALMELYDLREPKI